MGKTVADLVREWVVTEAWAPITGFPSYQVSSWGRVKRTGTGRVLAPARTEGYECVSLSEGGTTTKLRVNRLVALAFLGDEPFSGAVAAHNDGNRANNRIDNIRWATPTDNQRDRERHGTRVRGEDVFGAKLKESEVSAIRQHIAAGERNPSIAARYGVSISTIHLIRHNRIWNHVQ